MKDKIQSVIFGGDISAYSLAREFHEAYGIKSIALTTARGMINQHTSIIDTLVDQRFEDPDFLIAKFKEIKEKNPDKILIAQGCRDWQVRMLIENKDALKEYCLIPYIDENLLNSIVRKNDFYNLCDKYGIDHPTTFIYDFDKREDEIDIKESGLTYPLIAKPADSVEYYNIEFEGQKKVFRIDTEDELADLMQKVRASGYKGSFIIQDFIPGDDSNMRVLTCYCNKESKVVFAALGHTMLEDQEENSIGNPVAIINEAITRESPVLVQVSRFLEGIGYTGFANFDIKYDSRDGKYKYFEINTRLGASSLYILAGGINPVRYMVEELINAEEFTDFETTTDKGLYTKVHKANILEYLSDEKLKDEVRTLYSAGKVVEPLNYRGDSDPVHRLYASFFMARQKRRFSDYLKGKRWNDL